MISGIPAIVPAGAGGAGRVALAGAAPRAVGAGADGPGIAAPANGTPAIRAAPCRALIRSAPATKSCQILAGTSPPTTPFIGLSSSLPHHTPTTKSLVKPTNQASR